GHIPNAPVGVLRVDVANVIPRALQELTKLGRVHRSATSRWPVEQQTEDGDPNGTRLVRCVSGYPEQTVRRQVPGLDFCIEKGQILAGDITTDVSGERLLKPDSSFDRVPCKGVERPKVVFDQCPPTWRQILGGNHPVSRPGGVEPALLDQE